MVESRDMTGKEGRDRCGVTCNEGPQLDTVYVQCFSPQGAPNIFMNMTFVDLLYFVIFYLISAGFMWRPNLFKIVVFGP